MSNWERWLELQKNNKSLEKWQDKNKDFEFLGEQTVWRQIEREPIEGRGSLVKYYVVSSKAVFGVVSGDFRIILPFLIEKAAGRAERFLCLLFFFLFFLIVVFNSK